MDAPDNAADPCAAEVEGEYNMALHIAAIFIIMALSFLGTMLPILGRRTAKEKLPFQCLKLFGAGVILATAFIHMLMPAQMQLTDPCLPAHFQDYSAWAGAIALLGAFFAHFMQYSAMVILHHGKHKASDTSTTAYANDVRTRTLERGQPEPHMIHQYANSHADEAHVHSLILADAEKTVMTYVLELGIASHSIIIGVTLGAAREEFKGLLIALCFHQFFEGLAVSTVVMDADLKKKMIAIGMVLFYSLTTPVGIIIGIALNHNYHENATQALISTGVLDALSAGILLYDGLVNIVVPHFQAQTWRTASKETLLHFFFLWLGALAMAIIGRWA
ncbi:ZIP zinc/iron transporter [Spizellomyces punctatus DAOM BR117]|uniref:ZIP zinc/iron transporter n=1 Tax=Spizellomyces punctatus (strain DAOM BR117) TaxID=645134 RepID=A0A0L0HLB1_SPIPD|nr:ZIP zinc/iron transporter [Spizellomyces punctatus DAOM BR117]KND01589.1 ZIP zinc/iron transporter [Spizellomyces punctatus DAOM BR117]|eukprot:XP_016609628.1 ZIP zinc/iron transporter [Spizellomyces punctatus DAOM BR117]